MKLRNKKTGVIVDVLANPRFTEYNRDGLVKNVVTFDSLAELNEEWEDYEEFPEWYWVIEPYGKVECIKIDRHWSKDLYQQFKDFGNCFETKEEAKRAVEKLKAWKRLKNKGFRFAHFVVDHDTKSMKLVCRANEMEATFDGAKQFYEDIELLFGAKK